MISHKLNDRGTWLLVALALFGVWLIWATQKKEPSPVSPCLRPAITNRRVNCEGQGIAPKGLFLLLGTKIDLNRASVAEIALIPKLQRRVAEAIVDQRDSLGHFSSYEEIDDVKGVGPKTLESIKAYTTLGR